ncbi:MAG TPA: M67 family metallopeptidase [Terriglobia bacterium]|nr:M67 family metallopeptidase [Terriglobia bacterium]
MTGDLGPGALRLTIAPGLLERILDHLKLAYPNEGCGLVGGRNGVAERLIPMQNAAASPLRYAMDPAELVQAFRSLRESGDDLAAICHSHPSGPAYPSALDIAESLYPNAVQIIVSLTRLEHPVVRGFRIVGGRVLDVELVAMV